MRDWHREIKDEWHRRLADWLMENAETYGGVVKKGLARRCGAALRHDREVDRHGVPHGRVRGLLGPTIGGR
jgi:hypothetical protein